MLETILEKVAHGKVAERVMYYIGEFSNTVPYGDKILHACLAYELYYLGKGLNRWLKLNINPYVAGALTPIVASTLWENLEYLLPHTSISLKGTLEDNTAVAIATSLAILTDYLTERRKKANS